MSQGIVSFTTTALVVLSALAVVGLALFVLGLRGRRIGDELHCRKCGYNLTGLTSECCPECGRAVSSRNTVIGTRQRRRRLWVPGLIVLLASLSGLGGTAYMRAKRLNWYTYLPTFALVQQARGDDYWAINELVSRYRASQITEKPLLELVSVALARHGLGPHGPIPTARGWTNMLALLDSGGFLSQAQTETFHDQVVSVQLRCRPRVRESEEFRVTAEYFIRGAPSLIGAWAFIDEEMWIGERPAEINHVGIQTLSQWNCGSGLGVTVPAYELKPGTYRIRFEATKAFVEPCFERHIVLTRDVEVVPADGPDTVKLVSDPTLAEAFKKAIAIKSINQPWSRTTVIPHTTTYFEIETRLPIPMDGAFDIFARTAGHEANLGGFLVFKSNTHGGIVQYPCVADLGDSETVTVFLRPSVPTAKFTFDMVEIWNGELEFGPLKLNRVAPSAPTSQPDP